VPKEIYCRHCDFLYIEVEGMRPLVCPYCAKTAKWSETPRADDPTVPQVEYVVNSNDKRFLRSIRIKPDEAT
jgi:hypothetical protein